MSNTLAVFQKLREDILEVRLEPGSKLPVAALVERFGVSQGAVREALSRLVADGLVLALDQRGFRVSAVSPEDLQDITQTRLELEALAIRKSLRQGDAAWEARVLAAYHELSRATPGQMELRDNMRPWGILHQRFHSALVSACQSEWLIRFRDVLFDQAERYRKLSVKASAEPRNVDDEHRAIMEAAIGRDADRCIALLHDHFQQTATLVLRSMRAAEAEGNRRQA